MSESPSQVQSESGNSFLEDELEALRSIYISETNVFEDDESTVVSIDLHPATADNLQEQYVKLTLKLTVKEGYPDVIPEINIRNPRGLSDEKLSSITKDLQKIAEEKRGNSMLFEIIEAAKDYLTAGNRPCEECAICLYGFHEDDIFTKTECYHYFHSSCLARYAKNSSMSDDDSKSDDSSKNELLCPVCRLPISFDGVNDSYPSPVIVDDEFSMTDTMIQTQKKLQELYIKQVEKGGIIDLEAEKNKYLIEISHVPSTLDAPPEVSEGETTQQKDNSQTSSPEKVENDKIESQKHSSKSERYDRRYPKHGEERRESYPYRGNERYQSNRGNGYGRGFRNNYDRRYDSYNGERRDRYRGGMNSSRYSNPRRDNWHDSQYKSNRYDRRDGYDDRNGQRYGRNDRYEDRKNPRYERSGKNGDRDHSRYDKNSPNHERHDENNREKHDENNEDIVQEDTSQSSKQNDSEKGASCRDDIENERSADVDQKSENEDCQNDEIDNEKQSNRQGGYRRNVNYRGGRGNNRYDDRRENRHDGQNSRYDSNGRYGRFDDNRAGQYDRRNGRFEGRRYNEHNGFRRNENYPPGRNRYLKKKAEEEESKDNLENEAISTAERKAYHSDSPLENFEERKFAESEYHVEHDMGSESVPKDAGEAENAHGDRHELKSSDRRRNFPNRNPGARRQNDGRNYSRQFQRSNSGEDKYNGSGGYPKQSNYRPDRRQSKPQNFRKRSDDLDEEENSDRLKSEEAVAKDAGDLNESSLAENNVHNDEETTDISNSQHSRKTSERTDYKRYQDGRQGHRYQNNYKNYREPRPYRNNPRSKNNDYSDRTHTDHDSQKPASDSIPPAENHSNSKPEAISKSDESVPVETSHEKPTQVPPKSSEKSVPTSNFLPPMSSVAPPPGFLNPTRKIVYGLAAANPPPGFKQS